MQRRRHEKPIPRTNPGGDRVWVARYTNRIGRRKSAGTFKLKGPCRSLDEAEITAGTCCGQHAIDAAYEREKNAPVAPDTIGAYYDGVKLGAGWVRKPWLDRHPRSDRTNDTHRNRIKTLINVPVEGRPLREWPMAEIRRRHVNELVRVLLEDQGRAVEGAKGILRSFSAMVQDAIDEDELLEVNAFKGVKIRAGDPRVRKAPRKPRVVSWEEMHRLARSAATFVPETKTKTKKTEPDEPTDLQKWRAVYAEPMVRVDADCGPRLGELLAYYRIDFKLNEMCDEEDCPYARADGPRGPHVHTRRSAHNGQMVAGPFGTKRERLRQVDEGGRVTPLTPTTAEMLRQLPQRIDTPLMFPTPQGRIWWEDNFRDDVWNPARKASGVEASPQDFRHSWVTHLRAAGIDQADLAAMAGHSVATATEVYTHSLGRSFEAVASAVGS